MSIRSMCRGWMVDIFRGANTQDASGGPVRGPGTLVVGGVSCSIQPAGGNLQLIYAQRDIRVTSQAFFAQDVGLHTGWWIVTSTGSPQVRSWLIHNYTPGGEVGTGRLWVADLEERLL